MLNRSIPSVSCHAVMVKGTHIRSYSSGQNFLYDVFFESHYLKILLIKVYYVMLIIAHDFINISRVASGNKSRYANRVWKICKLLMLVLPYYYIILLLSIMLFQNSNFLDTFISYIGSLYLA